LKTTEKNIDNYLTALEPKVAASLQRLRKTIKETAPEAEEVISYNMPAFKYHGMLVYFAAFKNHCSLFGGNAAIVKEMKPLLKNFVTTKSSIHFTPEKPLPIVLIIKIVKPRMKENIQNEKRKRKVKL
jgi:uncharacterized protein YdhG (YjbR/CyaY superfamily)